MVSPEQARQLALALPEAIEQDHHGRPSFRVGGKIFATLWDESHMNVMLDEGGILTAVQAEPGTCEEVCGADGSRPSASISGAPTRSCCRGCSRTPGRARRAPAFSARFRARLRT